MKNVFNIRLEDETGNEPSFTQWDVDRKIRILGAPNRPFLHFANNTLKRAIVVGSEADGNTWLCRVPNYILQFPEQMVISVFIQPDEGRTVYMRAYPVQKKMKPQDYSYEENIGYVNWVQKSQEAQDLIDAIQAKLDSGELKGEKGDAGPQGVPGQQGASGAGFEANISQLLMHVLDAAEMPEADKTAYLEPLRALLTPNGYAVSLSFTSAYPQYPIDYYTVKKSEANLRAALIVTVTFADGTISTVTDYRIAKEVVYEDHATLLISYGAVSAREEYEYYEIPDPPEEPIE